MYDLCFILIHQLDLGRTSSHNDILASIDFKIAVLLHGLGQGTSSIIVSGESLIRLYGHMTARNRT